MTTNENDTLKLAFLDQENIPDQWEAILDREMMIRNQHITDIDNSYRRAFIEGTLSKQKPIRELMSRVVPEIMKGVQALINSAHQPDARKGKSMILKLESQPWPQFCYLALMTMLDFSTLTDKSLADLYHRITAACEDEARTQHWQETNPKFFKVVLERQRKKSPKASWVRKGLKIAMDRYAEGVYKRDDEEEGTKHPEMEYESWPTEYRKWFGRTFVEIILSMTNLFTKHRIPYGETKRLKEVGYKIQPSQTLLEWVGDANSYLGLHGGFYLPLPAPPRHWTRTDVGGFWTRFGEQLYLIKNNNPAFQEEVAELTPQLQTVFKAVNGAQDTAWRINQRVFDTLKAIVQEGKGVGGLPSAEHIPVPPCPICGQPIIYGVEHECLNNPAVKTEWKAAAKQVHSKNAKAKGQRIRLAMGLETADILYGDERFYFVYQCDFRGRLYPCANLSPQGSDWEKGLLEFADGVPLGEHGAKWLAVHVANQWGNDKVSYDEREKWTRSNSEWICDCAREPLIHREWLEADEPWQFLQACINWLGYIEEGDSYESHCPVGLDGSCSGIQHYSAMLRDEVGALATNVKMTPGQTRKSDIYGLVADKANEQFTKDMLEEAGTPKGRWATLIITHSLVDRKVTKRAVMTLPYGSTFQAAHKYITDELMEKTEVLKLDEKEQKKFCMYTAKTIWDSIPLVVKGARLGMNWLRAMAKLVSKSLSPVTWTTPSGFPVFQSYYLLKRKVITTTLEGSITMKGDVPVWTHKGAKYQINSSENSNVIDPKRQVSGIAPNFIHSLDASHLMFSVSAALDAGIHSFALVHDSLGTHAGKTEEFFHIIRQKFYDLYANNTPLETFREHITPQIPEGLRGRIPDIPHIGTLDIKDVLDAEYLFS